MVSFTTSSRVIGVPEVITKRTQYKKHVKLWFLKHCRAEMKSGSEEWGHGQNV